MTVPSSCLLCDRANESRSHLFFDCLVSAEAVCYVLWRERNLRLHNSTSRSAHLLIKEIQVIMKAKLIGMDRIPVQPTQRSQSFQESHLVTWFTYFQP
ncbi:BnaC05g40080D [Brassica napus]|uniref:BnaC05g40080D protein n=2 Tax=Brassica TaxID=3705 RepID=A0A078GE08_BRANA|nr:BnaC05g40080D [Brassica napus]VDD46581.1 unnamed protein product [Brassica oleracea]